LASSAASDCSTFLYSLFIGFASVPATFILIRLICSPLLNILVVVS
jgi:hypothetical protein